VEVAKSYYSCGDMEGVALENEGGSRIARYSTRCYEWYKVMHLIISSHWDKRTLNNEVMTGYLSRYSVTISAAILGGIL